jgi:hypothetical protein
MYTYKAHFSSAVAIIQVIEDLIKIIYESIIHPDVLSGNYHSVNKNSRLITFLNRIVYNRIPGGRWPAEG